VASVKERIKHNLKVRKKRKSLMKENLKNRKRGMKNISKKSKNYVEKAVNQARFDDIISGKGNRDTGKMMHSHLQAEKPAVQKKRIRKRLKRFLKKK